MAASRPERTGHSALLAVSKLNGYKIPFSRLVRINLIGGFKSEAQRLNDSRLCNRKTSA
jgi:hypothetical protein